MAEFKNIMQEFHRMCVSEQCVELKTCPMRKKSRNSCLSYAYENPDDFERTVMAWAAEHPEPVYPTWDEYITFELGLTNAGINANWFKPIPAHIAKKLGIKPKEG